MAIVKGVIIKQTETPMPATQLTPKLPSKTTTNAVTEWSCDWLHLFGGHGFDSLSTGRTMCSWVLMVVAQHPKKAITKNPHHEAPGQWVDQAFCLMWQLYKE